jgi:RecQ family ATP-dependent DNA helicase
MIEAWAVRLALWLDKQGSISEISDHFGAGLRLFGLDRFRDGQMLVVQAALSGKSVLVVSPTGFGKTLCFQLPGVLRPGISVVVSPLKALMVDQVSALFRRKIPSTFINSDLDQREKEIRYRLLSNNCIKFLYAAPERFFVRNKSELDALLSIRPAFMVIDEAHCVDQWGRDFRPEYGRLRDVRKALGSPPILAFTATAGREMQVRIMESLGIDDAQVFVRGVDRPNISLLRWRALRDLRPNIIAQLCGTRLPGGGKVMIFVPTRKIGEALQRYLDEQGLKKTPFYHSNFGTAWDREQLVKRFAGESRPAIDRTICTSAFGMGLDIPNVRMVIHWQQPSSVEDYLQEFGRAGRDGLPSVAIVFYAHGDQASDIDLLNFMAEKAVENSKRDSIA